MAITLTNTGEVALVCDVTEPLAGFAASDVFLGVGDQRVFNTAVRGLAGNTANEARATCTAQVGGQTLPT